MKLAEGCRRVEPRIIEDDDRSWDAILATLDRWGDRLVPKAPKEAEPYLRGIASLN